LISVWMMMVMMHAVTTCGWAMRAGWHLHVDRLSLSRSRSEMPRKLLLLA
jgi:hypothetical protein